MEKHQYERADNGYRARYEVAAAHYETYALIFARAVMLACEGDGRLVDGVCRNIYECLEAACGGVAVDYVGTAGAKLVIEADY